MFRTRRPRSWCAASRRRSRASSPAASAYSDTRLGWIGTTGSIASSLRGAALSGRTAGAELRELSLLAVGALDGRHSARPLGDPDQIDRVEGLRQVLGAPGAPTRATVFE